MTMNIALHLISINSKLFCCRWGWRQNHCAVGWHIHPLKARGTVAYSSTQKYVHVEGESSDKPTNSQHEKALQLVLPNACSKVFILQ